MIMKRLEEEEGNDIEEFKYDQRIEEAKLLNQCTSLMAPSDFRDNQDPKTGAKSAFSPLPHNTPPEDQLRQGDLDDISSITGLVDRAILNKTLNSLFSRGSRSRGGPANMLMAAGGPVSGSVSGNLSARLEKAMHTNISS